uniref:RAMA domain-containing protein n=1 Tax=Ciona intestinalis TaxID=7719 RepID=F6VA20_CIOIN
MRENRLEAILVARDKLLEELDQMGGCEEEDEDEDIESSQSILPVNVPLYKSFTVKLPTSTTTTKQSKMKRPQGFRQIQLPNKNTKTTSTRPIIYVVPNSCTTQKGTAMPVISRVKSPQIHHISRTPQPTKIKIIQHSNNQHHTLTNKPISTLPTTSSITPKLIPTPPNRFVNPKAPKPILLPEITQPKSFSPIFQALSQSGIPNIPMSTHMLPTKSPNTSQHPAQADIQQDKLDLNLSYLLKNKIIQQGSNALKLKSMGTEHVASLTSNGSILTSEFQLYVTPVAWIKGVTGRSYSKVNAFKMVTYLDEPLYNISMRVAQKTQAAVMPQQQTTFDDVRMTSTPQKSPVDDLVGFLMSCRIRLVQDDEFFITTQLCARHGGDEFEMMKHYIDTDW